VTDKANQRKTQDAVAARLKKSQQQSGMNAGAAARQNKRVADKLIARGKGIQKKQ